MRNELAQGHDNNVSCAAFFLFSGSVLLPNAAEITDLVSKHLQTKHE